MTILTKQSQISEASTSDLIATYNAFSGKPPIKRFSSRAAGESQTANAILKGQTDAGKKGVPKGTKPDETIAARAEFTNETDVSKNDLGSIHDAPPVGKTLAKAAKGVKRLRASLTKPPANGIEQMARVVAAKTAPADPKRAVKTLRCPLCNGEPQSQLPAGKPGTVAGDERKLCRDCGKEYWITGEHSGEEFKRRVPGRDASTAIKQSWSDAEVRAARSQKHRVRVGTTDFRSVKEAFVKLGLPLSKHIKFRAELKAAGNHTFNADDNVKHKFVLVEQLPLVG